jgi:hypothetical protein
MINVLTALWYSFPGLVEALHIYALVLVLELDLSSVTGARKGPGTIKCLKKHRPALPVSHGLGSQKKKVQIIKHHRNVPA